MANFNPADLISFMISFLFALCFHEWAHGFVAHLRGDDTAKIMGRLTLNPMAHADLFGTLVFPVLGFMSGGFLFGWAKPVPVNPNNLKSPKNDMFWVALAGPASNVFLAFVAVVLVAVFQGTIQSMSAAPQIVKLVQTFVVLNLFLAVFNMIPIHPLDGGKIVGRFLPASANRFLEENQLTIGIVFLGILIVSGGRLLGAPVYMLANLLFSIV